MRILLIEILPKKVVYLAPNSHPQWDLPSVNVWAPLTGASPLPMTDNIQTRQNETLEHQGPPALIKMVMVIRNKGTLSGTLSAKRSLRTCDDERWFSILDGLLKQKKDIRNRLRQCE